MGISSLPPPTYRFAGRSKTGNENVPPLPLSFDIEGFFIDDITAFLKWRNELVEMAEKVLKEVKKEVEEKGLKLSITEGVKEGAK